MKNRICLLFFFIFTFLIRSDAQYSIVPRWKMDIKNSLNSINKSNSLKVDNDGNCYVLGTTWYADSAKDIILTKYDTSGGVVWSRIYDNPDHGDDIPMNMSLDAEGNIWICGVAKMKNGNADFLLVEFNTDGIPVTDKQYDDHDHLFDCANAVVADKQGNIYAAGYETSLDSGINMIILKCRHDGSTIWKRSFATRQMDVANQLLLDDSSNVYVLGTCNNGPHSADILLQKYDPEGRKKWQLIYDGVIGQNDVGQYLSADDSMHIYVSGFVNHVNNRADIPLLKLNRNGQLIEESFFNGHISDCGSVSLLVRKSNVYIIGECDDYNIGVNSTFLLSFDKAGRQKKFVKAPEDVRFTECAEQGNELFVFGAKTSHPESTLMPFIAQCDSDSLTWTYADTTINGLAHITWVEMKGNDIFFLGDDTGDATGTINVFKYTMIREEKNKEVIEEKEEIKKPPVKKRR
jgi:hypothetical protein